jgi:cysteine desulfurase
VAYLDAASGRPLHPAAADAYRSIAQDGFADPSRMHREGRRARAFLDAARESMAAALGVRRGDITLLPGRAAATRYAVTAMAAGRAREAQRVLVGAVEHSDVLHAADDLAGPQAAPRVPVNPTGAVDLGALDAVMAEAPTALIAVQTANQEVGTRQPLVQVAQRCRALDIPLLVDACTTAPWEPLPEVGDVLIVEAASWGGPRSVAAVITRGDVRMRPGPLVQPPPPDVPSIVAAAAALEALRFDAPQAAAKAREQVAEIRYRVQRDIPDVDVVGDPEDRAPHIVAFSCLYVAGESIVTELDRHGISVASGSACVADTLEPSHVLAAMGALTHGNVRVSVQPSTGDEEIAALLDVLPGVVDVLRRAAGA